VRSSHRILSVTEGIDGTGEACVSTSSLQCVAQGLDCHGVLCEGGSHNRIKVAKMPISGDEILARTISTPTARAGGQLWSYDSRSDHHSKVACWGIVFDLLRSSALIRSHAADRKIVFGINHPFRDFRTNKPKKLDLVICRPALQQWQRTRKPHTLVALARNYSVILTKSESDELDDLPALKEGSAGNVLVAIEAKACMTEHQKAQPRLYDELNSSHRIVHGENDQAIAAGFVMVNIAERFISSDRNAGRNPGNFEWNEHPQPRFTELTKETMDQLPRRMRPGEDGYDALGVVVVNCLNDGSRVTIHRAAPAPQPGEVYQYAAFIARLRGFYESRFGHL
jgi:hypothetical protein